MESETGAGRSCLRVASTRPLRQLRLKYRLGCWMRRSVACFVSDRQRKCSINLSHSEVLIRQPTRPARMQLKLFATSPQIQQCPREIDPQLVALLARLLRQHADRKATAVGKHREGDHE